MGSRCGFAFAKEHTRSVSGTETDSMQMLLWYASGLLQDMVMIQTATCFESKHNELVICAPELEGDKVIRSLEVWSQ